MPAPANAPNGSFRFGPLSPTTEVPLLEFERDQRINDPLIRIMKNQIPGFVIRGNGGDPGPSDHSEVTDLVLSELDYLGFPFRLDMEIVEANRQVARGNGLLHTDSDVGTTTDVINVHATSRGTGRVMLAESGPESISMLADKAEKSERLHRLRALLAQGLTDPQAMSQILNVAELGAGDYVVFPFANRSGPMWHRFDTTSESRSADITLLERV